MMTRDRITHPTLTDEQRNELALWASVEGRHWKTTLEQQSWWRGIPARDRKGREYPSLYGLRNSHGPSWLTSYRLPATAPKEAQQ